MSYTQATLRIAHLLCRLVVKGDLDGDARAGQHVHKLAIMGLHTHRHTSDSSHAKRSCRMHSVPGMEGPAGLEARTDRSAPPPAAHVWLLQLWCIHCVVSHGVELSSHIKDKQQHSMAGCGLHWGGLQLTLLTYSLHADHQSWHHSSALRHLQVAQQGLHGLLLHVQLGSALADGQGAVPGQGLLTTICSTQV